MESSKRSSPDLIGSKMTESGLLDRAALNRQIEEILDGLDEKPSSGSADWSRTWKVFSPRSKKVMSHRPPSTCARC